MASVQTAVTAFILSLSHPLSFSLKLLPSTMNFSIIFPSTVQGLTCRRSKHFPVLSLSLHPILSQLLTIYRNQHPFFISMVRGDGGLEMEICVYDSSGFDEEKKSKSEKYQLLNSKTSVEERKPNRRTRVNEN